MAILGPTATGKSRLAMDLAERVGGAILSVDSMQVYRGMDIGTAKPTREEQARVRHHMIDIADPEADVNVAQFREAARRALASEKAGVVFVVGGSGLHFRSVVDPMTFRPTDPDLREELEATALEDLVEELVEADPDAGAVVDISNPRRVMRSIEVLRITGSTPSEWAAYEAQSGYHQYRPELEFVGFGLDRHNPRPAISHRLGEMRRAGFLDEVVALAPRLGRTASQAVGYRQLLDVVG
ncbi:MAG TPA: tRNA (adenosine(37)-N6)-dimethylallyltransferase MiaA, partial [Acidimicrobiia bacterium]|nr:tRNA (adenosine(37)-N6)-dimethylallyltransferase MiaA [Acidimicrobiia bacterium]